MQMKKIIHPCWQTKSQYVQLNKAVVPILSLKNPLQIVDIICLKQLKWKNIKKAATH